MADWAQTPLCKLMERINAKRSGKVDEWFLLCPFCEERGETPDTRYRLGINSGKGIARCFNCNYHKASPRAICADLCRVYGLGAVLVSSRSAPSAALPSKIRLRAVGLPEGYETFTNGKDYVERKALRYLTKRGITPAQIKLNRVGFAAVGYYAYRILFPVIGIDKKIYGVVSRGFANQEQRYVNSQGIRLCWGAQRRADIAVATEGIFDALAVENAVGDIGLDDLTPSVAYIALLGSTLTPQQCKQLKRYKQVWLFPDPDEPGIKGCITTVRQALDEGIENLQICMPRTLDGVDPSDMATVAIQRRLKERYPVTSYKAAEFKLRRLLGSH